MKLKQWIKAEKEFTDSIMGPWLQWSLGIIFFVLGLVALALYILYKEGLL